MVTTIGIDPHKATHTAVAIDDDETVLGEYHDPGRQGPDEEAARLGRVGEW